MTNQFNQTTTIEGVTYQVIARVSNGRKLVKALVERKQEDGSTVWAHMSNRQHKAESRAISRFTSEINAFFKGEGL
jgi:hypothetical protein